MLRMIAWELNSPDVLLCFCSGDCVSVASRMAAHTRSTKSINHPTKISASIRNLAHAIDRYFEALQGTDFNLLSASGTLRRPSVAQLESVTLWVNGRIRVGDRDDFLFGRD